MATPPNVSVTFTAEDRGVSAAIQALNVQLKELALSQAQVAASARATATAEGGMAASFHEAKNAAGLFAEEGGVKVNRELRGLLASSSLLGPALEAAFPIAAAIGFAMVLVDITKKVTEWIGDTFIYTEEMKKGLDEATKSSQRLEKIEQARVAAAKEAATAGLEGTQRLRAELAVLNKEEQLAVTQARARDPVEGAKQQIVADLLVAAKKKELAASEAKDLKEYQEGVLAMRQAMAAGDVALLQQRNEAEQAENERAYATGAASLNTYLDTRKRLIMSSSSAELAALKSAYAATEAEIATAVKRRQVEQPGAPESKDILGLRTKAEELQTRMGEVQLRQQKEIADTDIVGTQRTLENTKKRNDILIQTEAAEGKSAEAAGDRLNADVADLAILVKRHVITQEELDAYQRAKTYQDEIKDAEREAATQLQVNNAKRAALQAQFTLGTTQEADRRRQLAELERERLKALQDEKQAIEEIIAAEKIASDTGLANPDDIARLEEVNSQISQTKVSLQQLQASDIGKAIGADISKFFTDGIRNAQSFQDAIANLAKSVIADLQKMAAEFIITAIKKKMLESMGGGEGGGGGGGGGAGGLLTSIIMGLASGGPVVGPGGPKSDVIPAMLSSGEFVVNAAAVKNIGVQNLDAINRGMKPLHAMASALPHFAAGGFTGGELTTSSEVNLGIGLDEGLILRHLGSKAAGRVILQQLTNNPKGAQRALSRTD